MSALSRSVIGICLAAGAMYLFDPVSGHRRRLLLRHELSRAANRLDHRTRHTRRDLSHRAHDIAERIKSSERFTDRKVHAGIRNALKRATLHPKAVDVAVHAGHAILRGDVHSHEIDDLLDAVRSVPGVRVVTDHLTSRERAEGDHFAASNNWPLGIVVGAAGCGLLAWGIAERKTLGAWGRDFWHASEREIGETLDEAKQRAGEIAEAATEDVDDTDPGRPRSHRGRGERPGDSRAQVA